MRFSGWLRSSAAQALLWQRSRPALVHRALAGRPYRRAQPISGSTLRVAAIQRRIHLAASAEQYAAEAYMLTAAAVAYGAQLVCLPEYNGLHLLGLLPGMHELDSRLSLPEAIAAVAEEQGLEQSQLIGLLGSASRRVFELTWSGLARSFGVYIAAGSLLLPAGDGRLYNTLLVYDSAGRRIGAQRKLSPAPAEQGWVAPGEELVLLPAPTTTLAAAIGQDQAFWETGRAATSRGAEVLLGPAALDTPSAWAAQSRGLWARVQEVPAYGIQPLLVGELFSFRFGGRSGIYAPLALTAANDGVLALAEAEASEAIVAADLDLSALRSLRHGYPTPRRELVGRYLPRLYDEQAAARSAATAAARMREV